ncbi:ExeM/NucH family extracellular endonuclease [Deinococcus hopiensis]|uniref:ExeM/NucH family extracellular endonuclease n=1 Tax=Deinococcus hopiensis KR-140 TaxID=695939 RepID=A0A1W1VEM5_9DEIO|nr:ExeM/NucH family extracellular endonuclease [Deinococcus hopiensis]SMB91849.1 hypothetical protein SAMN00790413_01318 [Deinococcus hopiensis KR-140]
MTRSARKTPFTPHRSLLAGLLALASCSQVPQVAVPAAPAIPTRAPLKSLGVYELSVTGANTASPSATIRPTGLQGQAQEVGGLTFAPVSFGTFTDEATRTRHLRATFRVTNGSGQALTAPAYIPLDTEGTGATVGNTPFLGVQYFDGSDASARAGDIAVDTPRRVNSATGAIEADPSATPLVGNLNAGDLQVSVPAGQQLAGVAHQGWQGGAVAPGGEQVVTFAAKVPMAASSAQDPFAFRLVFSVADNPGTLSLTNVADVQGTTASGDAPSPLAGQGVTVEGVVTLVAPGLSGYFLQEEGLDADGKADTSDGLFVFCGQSCPTLSAGDRVRASGTVAEFRRSYTYNKGQPSEVVVTAPAAVTQLTNTTTTLLASGNALPAPVVLAPDAPEADRERYEGMRVRTTGVVTNNFPLGRFGSVDLATARISNYTQLNAPDKTGYAAFLADLPNRALRVDDVSTAQNPAGVFGRGGQPLSAGNTLRGGDTGDVTGVLHYDHDGYGNRSGSAFAYRVEAQSAQFTPTNPRLSTPENVGGSLRVASMNVLNFFTTLDGTGNTCTAGGTGSGGTTSGQAPRGANTCDEFSRQRQKIVSAIRGLNPDVLGVLEMQNDFSRGADSSIANLVGALNDPATGGTAGQFAYVNPGHNVGTDAISVALIYQPARVQPVGQLAILDNTVDPTYTDTCNRPTLAQTFQSAANGGRFTAVMAHLKSKGSACGTLGDADQGDGQGNGYEARQNAATAIVNWLSTHPTGVAEDDRILMGDLNAYRMEVPLQTLNAGGYGNLFGPESYSYQFDSQWGSLDHALATASLSAQVTGQTKWHINSDEPTVLDYNTEFKTAAQQGSLYAPDPFRSSDHDPLLIGLNLTPDAPIVSNPAPTVVLTPDTDSAAVTVGGSSVSRSFTAVGTNATGNLTVTVTPQGGAPALVTAPATATSGTPFKVTVFAPTGTTPGTYTYGLKAGDSGASDTSTLTVTVTAGTGGGAAAQPWINEFHYDNAGPDANEFVEVVVPSGVDPANLKVYLYNGNPAQLKLYGVTSGYALGTGAASGSYTVHTVNIPASTGLQNGNLAGNEPDGIALCEGTTLVEFLSYEGTFTPTDGCAAGAQSTNVGVVEDGSAGGTSIQRSGTGSKAADFSWSVATPASAGAVNAGQTLN